MNRAPSGPAGSALCNAAALPRGRSLDSGQSLPPLRHKTAADVLQPMMESQTHPKRSAPGLTESPARVPAPPPAVTSGAETGERTDENQFSREKARTGKDIRLTAGSPSLRFPGPAVKGGRPFQLACKRFWGNDRAQAATVAACARKRKRTLSGTNRLQR